MTPETKAPQRRYCEMCDRWFTRGSECPACGYPLRRAERERENCYRCDGDGFAGIHNCPRCGGSGKEPLTPKEKGTVICQDCGKRVATVRRRLKLNPMSRHFSNAICCAECGSWHIVVPRPEAEGDPR